MNFIHDRQRRRPHHSSLQDEHTDAHEEQRARPGHPFHAVPNSQRISYLENIGSVPDDFSPFYDPIPLPNAAVNNEIKYWPAYYESEPEVISSDTSSLDEAKNEIQNDNSDFYNVAEVPHQEDKIEISTETSVEAKKDGGSLQVQNKESVQIAEDARKDEQAVVKDSTEAMSTKKAGKEEDENIEKARASDDQTSNKMAAILPIAKPTSGGAALAGGGTDLNTWKANVASATATVPKPTFDDTGSRSARRVAVAARKAGSQLKGKRGTLLRSAKAVRRKAPDPGKPLPAPPPSPVPDADLKITEASNKKLPRQTLPVLEQRPQGTPKGFNNPGPIPRMDTKLAADIATAVSVKPQENDGHNGPTDRKNPNKKAVDKVRDAAKKGPDGGKHTKAGDISLALEDIATKPSPGGEVGTKGVCKEKMAGVLAELKRHSEKEADRIVIDARKEAYPGQSLHFQYKSLGDEDLKPQVKNEIDFKVESLRKVAGLSASDLDKAIEIRKSDLKKEYKTAKTEIVRAGKGSKEELTKASELHADDIASARNAVDTDTVQQLTAAGGEVDPEVIKLRRDQANRNLARRAARQDVYYEQAGKRRQKALNAMAKRYSNAYAGAAQHDHANHVEYLREKLIGEGKTKNDAVKQAHERAKIETAPIFKWAALQNREAAKCIAQLGTKADDTIKKFRQNVKEALDTAREMLNDWAQKKISEQESWWDKILNLYKNWAKEAQDNSEAWEEARNQVLRDKVAEDFALLGDIQAAGQSSADKKKYIAERGLDETQAMILQKYFAGAGKKGFKPDAIGAVAYGMRIRIRAEKKPKLIETMRSRVLAMKDSEWRKLARIADAERPPFNVVSIASDLHKAMDQWGTDEAQVYRSLGSLTPLQAKVLRAHYLIRFKISLDQHLDKELGGSEKTRAMALLEGDQTMADVAALHEAMHGVGTDEDTIMRVLRGKTKDERDAIIAEYKRIYGRDLKKALKSELDDGWGSHHDYQRASALLTGDTAKADAVALDQAMHGGWTDAGTDEAQITQVYEKIRAEVEAQAAVNGWSTEQMNAEIARRNKAVENAYETKYGDKKKYEDSKSALKKALEKELSTSELDFAMALADNDVVKADIAQLEVERTSFITDGDVVLKVLESQRARAEKEVRRDAEYDLRLRADMDLMRGVPWNQKKWASERKLTNAQIKPKINARSKQYMSNLGEAYKKKYSRFGNDPLQVLIGFHMTGNDRTKALDLVKTGGIIETSRVIFYAVNGPGTNVGELKRILKNKSPQQIRDLEAEWAVLYPKEPPLKERVFGEVGGRDHQDMVWALEGEPQTLDEKIKRAEERLKYEEKAYGGGNKFSKEEKAFMSDEYEELKKEKKRLVAFKANVKKPVRKSGESDDEFAIRGEEFKAEQAFMKRSFQLQEGYFDRSVEDHRAAVDEFADVASTVAAIVATIVVIAVVSIFTAGAGGAAIAAALASAKVAAAAAAAAGVATIGTKQLLKGSAYSNEELAVDAAIGVVDAAASALTAGFGGALLKTARQGTRITRLTTAIGRSKAASQIAKAAASTKTSTRVFANALAEGVEGVASSLPSALTGNVLREENWAQGNPLINILRGTLIETSIGVGLSGSLGGLGGLGKHADDIADAVPMNRAAHTDQLFESGDLLARRGTPAERLATFKAWEVSNPGKTYADFLSELDAGLIAKEVNEAILKATQKKMRSELLTGIPPAQRGQYANVPIDIMSDADFFRFTKSKSAKAVVIFEDGKPRVILLEGADPTILREEGIHLLQSKDPILVTKIAQLDETRLSNWDNLDIEEKFRLYRHKLDIEFDAQKRLIKSLDDQLAEIDDPVLRRRLLSQRRAAEKNLENLNNRLSEVEGVTNQHRMQMITGDLYPPKYLDQKPRLFNKEADDIDWNKQLEAVKKRRDSGDKLWDETFSILADLDAEGTLELGDVIAQFATLKESYFGRLRSYTAHFSRLIRRGESPSNRFNPLHSIDAILRTANDLVSMGQLDNLKQFIGGVHNLLVDVNLNVGYIDPFIRVISIFENPSKLSDLAGKLVELPNFRKKMLPDVANLLYKAGHHGGKGLPAVEEFSDDLVDLAVKTSSRDSIKKADNLDVWLGKQRVVDDAAERLKDKAHAFGLSEHELKPVLEEFSRSGRFHFATFKETQSEIYKLDKEKFARLKNLVEELKTSVIASRREWVDSDVGPVLRWNSVLEDIFDKLDEAGQNRLIGDLRSLLQEELPNLTIGGYKRYRHFVKDRVIDHIMNQDSSAEQFKLYYKFRAIVKERDNASLGEYFASFRRKIFDSSTSKVPSIQGELKGSIEIKGANRKIEGLDGHGCEHLADGAMVIKSSATPPRGPTEGRYLVEDKAGDSFSLSQARFYSDKLKEGGYLKTADSDSYMGVVYFCEDSGHANYIANKLANHGFHENIFVATFNDSKELVFIRWP